jgi:hypothetical protein
MSNRKDSKMFVAMFMASATVILGTMATIPMTTGAASAAEEPEDTASGDMMIVRPNGEEEYPNGGEGSASTLGAGEWDYKGERSTVSLDDPSSSYRVESGGGDFMFQIESSPVGGADYYLYEYDPNSEDEYVGWCHLYPDDLACVAEDIGNYVDGSNNRAEFYLREEFSGSARVDYWD